MNPACIGKRGGVCRAAIDSFLKGPSFCASEGKALRGVHAGEMAGAADQK
jgi:hypothetical protein